MQIQITKRLKVLHSGRRQLFLGGLDQICLAETNTLAYFGWELVTEKNSIALTPGANVVKLFCPSFTDFRTKPECLLDYTGKSY